MKMNNGFLGEKSKSTKAHIDYQIISFTYQHCNNVIGYISLGFQWIGFEPRGIFSKFKMQIRSVLNLYESGMNILRRDFSISFGFAFRSPADLNIS